MREAKLDSLFLRYRDRGDGSALAAVFDAMARELLDVACHLVRDPAEAEDLVQSTFLAAMRRAEHFQGVGLRPWLFGILWREGARSRRQAARKPDPKELDRGTAPDPLDALAGQEVPSAVRTALAELPARYREVLEPLLVEGRASEDIARTLERPAGTVRSQIHRGLTRLRKKLPAGLFGVGALPGLPRGLDAVRAEVLGQAGVHASLAAPSALTLGTLAMSKSVALSAATLTALGVGTFAYLHEPAAGHSQAPAVEANDLSLARGAELDRSNAAAAAIPVPATAPRETLEGAAALPEAAGIDLEHWLARFGEAPDDWRHGWSVAREIAALPPEEALEVMRGVWPHLSVPVKEQSLKPFVFHGGHPLALPVLDLAARDESLSVQQRAFTYLESYAFRDFSVDYGEYLAWSERWRDAPVAQVLEFHARELASELTLMTPDEIAARLEDVDIEDQLGDAAGIDLASTLREAGALRAVEMALTQGSAEAKSDVLSWANALEPKETWLRQWILPEIATATADSALHDHFHLLGHEGNDWAREPILDYLHSAAPGEGRGSAMSAAMALGNIGDLRAVPGMIEVLLADPEGDLTYDVGYFGLSKLTGVKWKDTHDAEFWVAWWENNKERLPEDVRGITIAR